MNKIKELRKEKNITVAELAKELGISQSMLTNYENGNGTPRDESIWELSLIHIFLGTQTACGLWKCLLTVRSVRVSYWRRLRLLSLHYPIT